MYYSRAFNYGLDHNVTMIIVTLTDNVIKGFDQSSMPRLEDLGGDYLHSANFPLVATLRAVKQIDDDYRAVIRDSMGIEVYRSEDTYDTANDALVKAKRVFKDILLLDTHVRKDGETLNIMVNE